MAQAGHQICNPSGESGFNGRPVSFCLALDAGRTRYIIANSYDPEIADFSTGSTIYREVITQAIAAGLTELHIGQGDSGYKSRWRAEDVGGLIDIMAFHLVSQVYR